MNKKMVFNMGMLYLLSAAKIIFPFITLPYLTRILTTDSYGIVAYEKAVMQYLQVFIDFGFLLSGPKYIIDAMQDKRKLGEEVGNILIAKICLGIIASVIVCILMLTIPILKQNWIYTILSFVPVFLTCFLFDYLFRGLEEMHVITKRFVLMKLSSTIFTFIMVKDDSDILWMPTFDIVGTMFAIVLIILEIKKRHISIYFTNIVDIANKIKLSAIYFLSDVATLTFGALNTLLIGMYASMTDVAYWVICTQLLAGIQSMYVPIINTVYPVMLKKKELKIIHKTLVIVMPIVIFGCLSIYLCADLLVVIIGGDKYREASGLLKNLIPVILLSFPSMLFGWPTLGAIDKPGKTMLSTVVAATVQLVGIVILTITSTLTLFHLAILRGLVEFVLLSVRSYYCYQYRVEFRIRG